MKYVNDLRGIRMKRNKWLCYFLYGLLLIAYFISSHIALEYLNAQKNRTFVILPFEIWTTVIYTVGGILLGLETFILEVKKKGSWKVNWPKVIFLGIPAIYLAVGIFFGYIPITFVREVLQYPFLFLYISKVNLVPIFQIAFGYILITSFVKIKK